MIELRGRTAVITGAGRGLGKALAISLAQAGCSLVLCGRNSEALECVAETILRLTGSQPACIAVDLANSESVQQAVEGISRLQDHVDLLVNNGAMWLEASDVPYTAEDVLGVVNSAVTGTFLFTQGLLPRLLRSSCPDIVTIGSTSGLPNALLQNVAVPFYAAKRAQAAIADGLQQMLSETSIRSIAVHPTNLDDIQPGEPEWAAAVERAKGARGTNRDVVEAVLFAVTRPRHITLSMVLDAGDGGLFPAGNG
ncbi:SDR family oxidoreductase [Shinella sp.]|uniref:SDR family oxidoreductase n=1 Tax=Shinella sp. TaxID=1870904 RepID=UPI0028AB4598|nr:SDR family oxidoreductase [Shinella sp.]